MGSSRISPLSRTVAIVVIVSSVVMAFYAARWAIADIHAYSVRYAIERWQKLSTGPGQTDINEAKSKANQALSWMPDSAEYYELRARVFLYAASHPDSENAESDLLAALSDHERAIEHRPNWPYSWASKALIKAYLTQFDNEYTEAIKRAESLGPWESSVNLMLLEAGVLNWGGLSKETRQSVVSAAERAAHHRWRDVRNLLNRYNKRFPVCSLMRRNDDQKKVCKL